MKKLLHLLIFMLIAAHSFAQVPQGMNYQAVLRNNNGEVMQNTNVCVQSTITDGNGGTMLYQETFDTTTNKFGLFTLVIGSGTPVSGTFAGINWGGVNAWQTIELKINCTGNYITMGSSQLLSVPYALYSKYSDNTPGTGFTNMAVFTSDSAFTIPNGITKMMVEAWGGGGGGAGNFGSGGGGGGYGKQIFVVTPGSIYNIVIGQGGTGGQAGGATSVGNLVATGGEGGSTGANGGNSNATFSITGQPGSNSGYSIGGSSPNGGAGGDLIVNTNGLEPGGGGCRLGNGAKGRVVIWY